MILRRILTTLVPVLISGLLLAACATADAPDLGAARGFRAFPVYYAGDSVAGLPLEEVLGDPSKVERRRDLTWYFIYGSCQCPPAEGGCPYPLQIHDYSTCKRWAGLFGQQGRLVDFRGAKAIRSREEQRIQLEIFTGRTTVTISGEDAKVIDAAARALRTVRQGRPSPLPPPVPGSLEGELPCQARPAGSL
ncbi:MAG TPA: hypothetical protein VJ204_02895 [Solirubrobacterales bacterium]|nr:hypothetical protein [Solirubrobacterales bacterium]